MAEIVPTDKQLHDFVDDLERCIQYEYPEKIECNHIILCGMGGSAISGNIVADYCVKYVKKPITVVMNACLPNWVDENTLVVISSYSGNTLETLESYKQCLSIGCKVFVITSGGYLEQLARKNRNPLIMLPNNLHPRHSIGYMIGYIFGVIRSASDMDLPREILESIEPLREYRNELEDTVDGLAMKMAKEFIHRIPVICSYSDIQSIVFRWKTQFNENSKHVAFCITIPELFYSDIDGWIEGARSNYLLTIIVDESRNDIYASKLIKKLDDNNVRYKLVKLKGKTRSENMFRALLLGDYTSMYMAQIMGIDPSGVPPITSLKVKLKPMIEDCVKNIL